jgi:hypothetical protein
VSEDISKHEYLAKYAELKDGNYYYKTPIDNNFNDFWVGPYGIKVPTYTTDVLMPDGFNLIDKWGNQTTGIPPNDEKMDKEIYLAKYAVLGRDGDYYYK